MAPHITPALKEARNRVRALLAERKQEALRRFLKKLHPADIADLLEMLDEDYRVEVFNLLRDDIAAEVLDETRTDVMRNLVDAVPDDRIADLLEEMPEDDAAEILEELKEDRAEDILELMEPEEAAEVEALLAYPEDTAGRLMTTRVVRLRASWTVDRAIQYLRSVDTSDRTLAYLYVVDDEQKLVGVLPVWSLLTASPDTRISDLMDPDVISVQADADQEEVARIVAQYDFFAVPVVDRKNRLLGIITHDDVIDILQDEFTEDVQRFGGSEPLEQSYFSTSILAMVRKRVGWLFLLFLTATLTGTVMRLYEDELQRAVALSFFIPLLIGTGGNAGSQMTATMIRALAVGEVSFEDMGRVLFRELLTGFLLGMAMSIVGLIRALTWEPSLRLGLTVAASLCALVVWANLMGAILPVIAARLKVDPTVISGPVMSTLVDATGLLIYFNVARLIMGL